MGIDQRHHPVLIGLQQQQIGAAIPVQVDHRSGEPHFAGKGDPGSMELPQAVAEEDGDHALVALGYRQILQPVQVEIPLRDIERVVAHRYRLREEYPRPVAIQQADAIRLAPHDDQVLRRGGEQAGDYFLNCALVGRQKDR